MLGDPTFEFQNQVRMGLLVVLPELLGRFWDAKCASWLVALERDLLLLLLFPFLLQLFIFFFF